MISYQSVFDNALILCAILINNVFPGKLTGPFSMIINVMIRYIFPSQLTRPFSYVGEINNGKEYNNQYYI